MGKGAQELEALNWRGSEESSSLETEMPHRVTTP